MHNSTRTAATSTDMTDNGLGRALTDTPLHSHALLRRLPLSHFIDSQHFLLSLSHSLTPTLSYIASCAILLSLLRSSPDISPLPPSTMVETVLAVAAANKVIADAVAGINGLDWRQDQAACDSCKHGPTFVRTLGVKVLGVGEQHDQHSCGCRLVRQSGKSTECGCEWTKDDNQR